MYAMQIGLDVDRFENVHTGDDGDDNMHLTFNREDEGNLVCTITMDPTTKQVTTQRHPFLSGLGQVNAKLSVMEHSLNIDYQQRGCDVLGDHVQRIVELSECLQGWVDWGQRLGINGDFPTNDKLDLMAEFVSLKKRTTKSAERIQELYFEKYRNADVGVGVDVVLNNFLVSLLVLAGKAYWFV